MAQLMPVLLNVSCFSKIQIGLPFWYRLTQVLPDKGPLNGCVCYKFPTGGDGRDAGDALSVCRTLVSSLYQRSDGDAKRQQISDGIRTSLLRRFGAVEFSRLRGATRDLLVMTSHGGEVARQRRLDAVLASNDAAAVYFPLFVQLAQLETITAGHN